MSITTSPPDADRPVDQFVDEVLDRLSALHALIDDAEHPPLDTDRARRAGQQLISRLRAGPAPAVADRLVNALWSSQRGGRVPAGWLSTPLGNLLQDATSAAGRTATAAARHGARQAGATQGSVT